MGDNRKMPTEKAIRAHWREWVEARIDDPDDGVCFACGMIEECERAHITARAQGGPDTVENLHMLCKDCHKASEGMVGRAYWLWIEHWTFEDRLMLMCSKAGVPMARIMRDGPENWTDYMTALLERIRDAD